MSDRLFPFLVLLTLLDLAFVQATGVVSGAGLLPLWGLALGSPWLRRLQSRRTYRLGWNGVVLLVFALLVHHASTTGLLYMLEDGLLLAVLCQVHLLNNVGERQRPDLVFFNSFLVAFVTAFFAPDLTWSLLFVAHAFAFVPSLQVNVLARRAAPAAIPPHVVPAALRDALRRTLAVVAITALAFVVVPRNFARQGWLGDALVAADAGHTGIAEQIRLDNEVAVRLGDDVVMRLEPASGDPADVPMHWRAIAFSSFDGTSWLPQDASRLGTRFATDPAWEGDRDGTWRRGTGAGAKEIHVRLHDRENRRLPCPLAASQLRLATTTDLMLDPKSYGVLGVVRLDPSSTAPIDYTVVLADEAPGIRVGGKTRLQMVMLPAGSVPPIVGDLAERLRRRLPPEADDEAVARACSDWLQNHRRYELPGRPGFARNLGEFLVGTGAGHCEYFATALALMLRVQNIPCRLVGGYLAHEWDPEAKAVIARSRHAHAWVEVLRENGGWLTLDATPPADVMSEHHEATSWWSALQDGLADAWGRIVTFDDRRRADWLRSLLAAPGAVARAAADHATVTVLVLASIAALVYRRARRRQTEPAIVELERAARAAGLSLLHGETPRELLVRANGAGIEPARLARLSSAARRHERVRYGTTEREDAP